jgi:hypothetical protein
VKKNQIKNSNQNASFENLAGRFPQLNILSGFMGDQEVVYTRSTAVHGLVKNSLKALAAALFFVLLIIGITAFTNYFNFEHANDFFLEVIGVVFGLPLIFIILLSLSKGFDLFYLLLTGNNFDVAGGELKPVKILLLVLGFLATLTAAFAGFFYISDTFSNINKKKELNKEQKKIISILNGGRASWNKYITQKPMMRIDFTGADLSKRQFNGYFFEFVDFSEANLNNTTFNDCYLAYAKFNKASCDRTIFKNSYLKGSDFIETDLTKIQLIQSYGKKGDFSRAEIPDEKLKKLLPPEESHWDEVSWYDYHEADWLREKGYYFDRPPKGLKF